MPFLLVQMTTALWLALSSCTVFGRETWMMEGWVLEVGGDVAAAAWNLTRVSREMTLNLSADMVFCAAVCCTCNKFDSSMANLSWFKSIMRCWNRYWPVVASIATAHQGPSPTFFTVCRDVEIYAPQSMVLTYVHKKSLILSSHFHSIKSRSVPAPLHGCKISWMSLWAKFAPSTVGGGINFHYLLCQPTSSSVPFSSPLCVLSTLGSNVLGLFNGSDLCILSNEQESTSIQPQDLWGPQMRF